MGVPDSDKQKKRKPSTKSFTCSGMNSTASHSSPKRISPKHNANGKKLGDKGTATRHRQDRGILFPPNEHQFPSSMPPAIYPTKLFLTNTDNMNTENRVSPQAPEIEEAIIGACLIELGSHTTGSRQAASRNVLRPAPSGYLCRHTGHVSCRNKDRHPHRKRRAFPP